MSPRTTNFDTWRNLYWADLSGQLYALQTINNAYFDSGTLLKKDTGNGAWLWGWLVPSSLPWLLPLFLLFPPFPFPPFFSLFVANTDAPPFQHYTYHQHSATARETMTIDVLPPGLGSAACVGVRLVRKVRKRMWITVSYYVLPCLAVLAICFL